MLNSCYNGVVAKNKYLDRRSFRQYLVDNAEIKVGMTRDIHDCPIANFLEGKTYREWHVSPLACVPQVDAGVEDHEFRTSKWAREFIHNLDRHNGRKPMLVTGGDALYVLDEYV